MKDDFDLVLAQRAFQQIGTAQIAAHHVDAVGQPLAHKFAGGNPVAYQRRHGRTLPQQAFCQPSAHQSRGASDKDRKSTRLNSSHLRISYAVFCLKKIKAHSHRSPPIPDPSSLPAPSPTPPYPYGRKSGNASRAAPPSPFPFLLFFFL